MRAAGHGFDWGCATDYAPNDSASRGLNEMKASKAPIPPKPDPREIRIAELERAIADRDLDIIAFATVARSCRLCPVPSNNPSVGHLILNPLFR